MPVFPPTVRPAKGLQRRASYNGVLAKILPVAKEEAEAEGDGGFPDVEVGAAIEEADGADEKDAGADEEVDVLWLIVLVMNSELVEFATAFMLEKALSVMLAI